MTWHTSALIFGGIGLLLCLAFVGTLRSRRRRYGSGTLLVVLACTAVWNLAMAGAILVDDHVLSQFLGQVLTYPLVGLTMAGAVILTLTSANPLWRPPRAVTVLLLVEPAAMLVLAVTNHLHNGLAEPAEPVTDALVAIGDENHLARINTVYLSLVLLCLLVAVVRRWRRTTLGPGIRLAVTTGAVALVVVIGGLDLWQVLRGVDPTPAVAGVVALGVVWAANFGGFFDLMPTTRTSVLDYVDDAVLVLNADQVLVEFNASARRLAEFAADGPMPLRVGMSLEELRVLVPAIDEEGVFSLARNSVSRRLEVRMSELAGRRGAVVANTLVLRDVTDLYDQRVRLEETNTQLTTRMAEIEELHARLRHLAAYDELTGLPNRRSLGEDFEVALRDAADHATPLAVMMIDIDRFKSVNDRHGHAVGDLVLQQVARTIGRQVREGDSAARYGGEEFTVLLPGLAEADAVDRAEQILQAIRDLQVELPSGTVLRVTVSIGVAVIDGPGTVDALLAKADRALYRAKRRGRDRVELDHEHRDDRERHGA